MSVSEISVTELKALEPSDIVIIDVRESDEYVIGHIPGAISIPLSVVQQSVDAFRHDRPVYVVCQVGGRSQRACEFLEDYDIISTNVSGGTGAWVISGFDVVVGVTPG